MTIALLNIRGLSEIVFLNLLLQQQLISPALAGINRTLVKNAEQARSLCANS